MKVATACALILGLNLVSVKAIYGVEVESKIERVTLFGDRALIERVAPVSIVAGDSVIKIVGLPNTVDRETLKISGAGSAKFTIGGVDFEAQPMSSVISEKVNDLRIQLEKSEEEAASVKEQIAALATQRKLVGEIRLDLPDGGERARPRTAQEMREILKFIGDSSGEIGAAQLSLEKQSVEIAKKIGVLRQALNQTSSGGNTRLALVVPVSATGNLAGKITIAYQTMMAGWRPSYTLYSERNDKGVDVEIEVSGMVTQSTGEDWSNVELVLSTARPSRSLERPEAYSLELNQIEVYPASRAVGFAAKSAPAAMNMEMMDATAHEDSLVAADAFAEFQNLPGIVAFKLPKKVSINGDSSEKQVKIQRLTLNGATKVVSVPYLSSDSYEELVATIEDMPLLPAQMRVVNNGNLVGSKQIPFIPKGGELGLPLGTADDVQVTRTQVKKFQDDPGIIRSFKRLNVVYEIEVKNLGDYQREVAILERGVVSQNEKIKVSVVDVKPERLIESDSSRISKRPGIWEWRLSLKPRETSKISYKVVVEVPADIVVPGLDSL